MDDIQDALSQFTGAISQAYSYRDMGSPGSGVKSGADGQNLGGVELSIHRTSGAGLEGRLKIIAVVDNEGAPRIATRYFESAAGDQSYRAEIAEWREELKQRYSRVGE